MSTKAKDRRVYLLGNPQKAEAEPLLKKLESFAASRCKLVGASMGLDGRPAVAAGAERLIVLGGDGTLIGVARSLGQDQIPLIGVNVGKLGFLAEFSPDEIVSTFDRAVSDDGILRRGAILHVTIHHDGNVRESHLAINDCVIQAGPPFRLISLGVEINGDHLSHVEGDGLIVCTPTGSTAHNLSAGGPIMQPGVDAMVLTPLCPHSLTHKPLVIERDAVIDIRPAKVNEGTTLIIDGQVSAPLGLSERVSVRRFEKDFILVRNPLYAGWHKLISKLHWGRAPSHL
ncbi:MAG: NAD(+)/NADH kinase [Phycisphaerae bacterium]|nr:NAD(+)/NADH kinase [Phycisphaerae bacterium]